VYDLVSEYSLRINDEEPAKCDTLLFDEYAIVTRRLLGDVSGERIVEAFDAGLVAGRLEPGAV
jgi:hypothetical protein